MREDLVLGVVEAETPASKRRTWNDGESKRVMGETGK